MSTPDIRAALERLVETDDGCSAAEWAHAIPLPQAGEVES